MLFITEEESQPFFIYKRARLSPLDQKPALLQYEDNQISLLKPEPLAHGLGDSHLVVPRQCGARQNPPVGFGVGHGDF